MKRLIIGAAAAVLAFGVSACGGDDETTTAAGGTTAATETISFGATGHDLTGNSYVSSVPTTLGYWKDEGLEVDLQQIASGADAITAVATGKVDVGAAGTRAQMAAAVNGGAKTKGFFSYTPGNSYWPVVVPDSKIQTLKDLENTTMGAWVLGADGPEQVLGLMRREGLDADSVKMVAVGGGAEAYDALKRGRIQSYVGFDTAYGQMEALGLPLRAIPSPLDDMKFGSTVFANQKLVDEQTTLVKFGRGLAKAALFTKTNPECAVKVHWKQYPESKPAGVSDDEAMKRALAEVDYRMKAVFPVDDKWGYVSDEPIKEMMELVSHTGVDTSKLQISDIWTPDLLTEINDFDHDQVEEQAKTCAAGQ